MKTKNAGLTLIEALVVIAIICLMVAIILPSLNFGHRHSAPRARCTANVKQVSCAALALAMDNAEKWPGGLREWNSPQILTNVSDLSIFRCPSDKGAVVWPTNTACVHKAMGTSYAFAWTGAPLAGVSGAFDANGPLKITSPKLSISSKKILFFEPTLCVENREADPRTQWHFPRRGSVIGFLDGHAEFVTTNYTTLPADGSETNRYYY